jgi:hypothetical protein
MFPGRIGMMVIDSVADPDDYVSGAWRRNLDDAVAAVDHFHQTYFDAGHPCPLRQGQDRSPADVKERVGNFIQSLETSPASAIQDPWRSGPTLHWRCRNTARWISVQLMGLQLLYYIAFMICLNPLPIDLFSNTNCGYRENSAMAAHPVVTTPKAYKVTHATMNLKRCLA